MGKELVARILALYAEIDRCCVSFQVASGLRCLEGCGICCNSLKVEATPVEMLPAVSELFLKGEGVEWHERFTRAEHDSKRCVFYSPEPLFPSNGHCRMYAWRPIVCRLFGFAA